MIHDMRSKQQSSSRVIIMHLSLDQRLFRPHLVNDAHEVSNRKLIVFLHGYGAQVGIGWRRANRTKCQLREVERADQTGNVITFMRRFKLQKPGVQILRRGTERARVVAL